jgi:single-strand DNA-binding protein
MASLNKVQLIGNVGNDPDIRNVQGGAKTASFRLATTTRYKDRNGTQQEDTEWHNITVWNGRAEFVEKYIRKGAELYIEGKIRTRQWTDQSGNKRFTTEIVADNIQILMDRRNNGAPANNAPAADDDLPIF